LSPDDLPAFKDWLADYGNMLAIPMGIAYSGDPERPIRSIVNTQSADPEHAPELA
jgi:hypothetical protein